MISVDVRIEKAYGERYRAEVAQPERLGMSASYTYGSGPEDCLKQLAEAFGAAAYEVLGRFKASGPNVEGPWVGRIFVNESLALKAALRQIATLAAPYQATHSAGRRIYDIARNAIIAVEG
jgi:hypothetical protein